ncbi:MAG: CvpA family protein [Clostridia bacterium]|nr:CvpA family protein [Clostridia bacterium]
MGAFLDVICVFILLFCLWSAASKGFVRALVGLVGTLVAVIAAWIIGPTAADFLRTHVVAPFFEGAVSDYLMTYLSGAGESFAEQFRQLLTDLPPVLEEYLLRFSVSPDQVREAFEAGGAVQDAAVSAIADPLVGAVSSALGFLLTFFAVRILLWLLTEALDAVMRLPVLRTVNKGLGMLLGIAQGLVICCVFAAAVSVLAPYLVNYLAGFNAETISSTLVFRFFYELSPFRGMI